jgi:hypothetical protein
MPETATTGEQFPQRRRILLNLIDRVQPSRSLNEENVVRLQESIKTWGLMQAVVVIMAGLRYLLCIGNHRCEALLRSGATEVDALVLPEGTTPDEALIRSLHENNVRHDESLPDIMKRVTALKNYHGCQSFAEAADLAGISESQLSKIRFAMETFTPEGLSLIHEHQIGSSVAYEIAKRANGVEEQLEWLAAHARGEMSRDGIVAQSKRKAAAKRTAAKVAKKPMPPRPRAVKLNGRFNEASVTLVVAAPTDSDASDALTMMAKQIIEHFEGQRPLSELSFA